MKTLGKSIKTVLFDLDGTLVDTEPSAARAIQSCFKDWGLEVTREDAGFITGRTWAVAFEYLFNKFPLPVSRTEAAERMMKRYREDLEKNLAVVPGGAAAVRDLANQYDLALVSGSNRAEIFWALDQLKIRNLFKVILGAEDYPRSKPAPDGYLKALQLLGAEPDSSLVFEDSEAGISSAKAGGLWVVAITSTNHFGHNTSQAHGHIEDLQSVNCRWVEEFAPRS